MRLKAISSYKITISQVEADPKVIQSKLDDAFDFLFDEIYKELCEEDKEKEIKITFKREVLTT